jgi:hypothetical protein
MVKSVRNLAGNEIRFINLKNVQIFGGIWNRVMPSLFPR